MPAALIAATLLAACGGDSATSAPDDFTVSTSVSSIVSTPIAPTPTNPSTLTCDVTLHADVRGTGSGPWLDGSVDFTSVVDSVTVLGSIPFTESSLKHEWGADSLKAGQSITSLWRFSSTSAFGVAIRMRYQTPVATRTSSAWARCSPP